MFRSYFMLVLCVFASATHAFAGPFGTNMGDSLQKFPTAKKISTQVYSVSRVPNGYPLFKKYILYIDEVLGLYQIEGISSEKRGNDAREYSFEGISSDYLTLESLLFKKYGEKDTTGQSMFGYEKSFWNRNEDSNLPKEIESILLRTTNYKYSDDWDNSGEPMKKRTYQILLRYKYINSVGIEQKNQKNILDTL